MSKFGIFLVILTFCGSYKNIGCYNDNILDRALRYGPYKYGYIPNNCSIACLDVRAFNDFTMPTGIVSRGRVRRAKLKLDIQLQTVVVV